MNHELDIEQGEGGWRCFCSCGEWDLRAYSDFIEDWELLKMIRKKFLAHKNEGTFVIDAPQIPTPWYPEPYDGTGNPSPWWQNPVITWNGTDLDDDSDTEVKSLFVEFR